MTNPPPPKMTNTLNKAEALSHAATQLRSEASTINLIHVIAQAIKKGATEMPADLAQMLRDMPEMEIQIKARNEAADMIEALSIEERVLSARMTSGA